MFSSTAADNCAVNRALARRVGLGFVGCHSHRFKLAVQDIILGHHPIISKENELMKINKHLSLAEIAGNDPLSSGNNKLNPMVLGYFMLTRYNEIKDHIIEISSTDNSILELIPTPAEEFQIVSLYAKMQKLNPVTLLLQAEKITISTFSNMFDDLISGLRITKCRLSEIVVIAENPCLEAVIVKIKGRTSSLTVIDSSALKKFSNLRSQSARCIAS